MRAIGIARHAVDTAITQLDLAIRALTPEEGEDDHAWADARESLERDRVALHLSKAKLMADPGPVE